MQERCRLISESQWREYQELVTKCHRLEQQLNEANDVIKKYAEFNNWEGDDKDQHDMTHFIGEDIGCGWSLATDYLERYGVK